MKKSMSISDAELPIMKILWEYGELSQPEIFDRLDSHRSKSTIKTLIQRLVAKGAVKSTEINARSYSYKTLISREEYTSAAKSTFLSKVFDGSKERLLVSFIKEQKMTREDIEKLMDMIEEEE